MKEIAGKYKKNQEIRHKKSNEFALDFVTLYNNVNGKDFSTLVLNHKRDDVYYS